MLMATRPPSSGGRGIMLKIARTRFSRIDWYSVCATQAAAASGSSRTRWRGKGQHHIRERPGKSNQRHVATRPGEMAEGNRDRLGPAEQEGSFEQKQKGRDQDCPKRVDMLERVERDAAQPKGGVIPEPPGRVCVRRFMERDRDKDRNGPGRGCVEDARKLQGDLLRRPINGGPPLGLSTPTSGRVSRAASAITLVRRGPGGNWCPALK